MPKTRGEGRKETHSDAADGVSYGVSDAAEDAAAALLLLLFLRHVVMMAY